MSSNYDIYKLTIHTSPRSSRNTYETWTLVSRYYYYWENKKVTLNWQVKWDLWISSVAECVIRGPHSVSPSTTGHVRWKKIVNVKMGYMYRQLWTLKLSTARFVLIPVCGSKYLDTMYSVTKPALLPRSTLLLYINILPLNYPVYERVRFIWHDSLKICLTFSIQSLYCWF